MSKALYLPFDTETGGIRGDVCLLSAHFAVADKDFNILDELDLLVKPDDGHYMLTARALEINKIDIMAHDKVAIEYKKAGGMIRDFIWKHSDNGKIKLMPVGKNVAFDVLKVTDNLLNSKTFHQYVSYRVYDITTLVELVKRAGLLPYGAPDSLEELCHHYEIPIDAHTAKGDNLSGVALVKKLESLLGIVHV